LAALIQRDGVDKNEPEKYATTVVLLARRMEAFGDLAKDRERWQELKVETKYEHLGLWTDDYSNLFGIFNWNQ
jgi:hypothetical protein